MPVKKMSKKSAGEKSKPSRSPLTMAKGLLVQALKSADWQATLDPGATVETMPHLPSGSIVIDQLIGGRANKHGVVACPGYPKGRIVNLYGHEGSGKTTLALTAAATTIREGGTVCYIDWEHEIVPSYALALGVPIHDEERFMLCQPDTLDEGVAVLWTMASAGVDLIVLDSVGAAVTRAQFEKSIKEKADQGRVGGVAAVWSQFLPELKGRINRTSTTVIGISQIRDAISTSRSYGDTVTVQGGNAWKFYSAVRMRLRKIGTEKATNYSALSNKAADRVVGAKIRVKLDKCKVSDAQGNEEEFYIRWGEGIDDLRSMIEIALAHRCITKAGAYYTWIDPEGNEHKRAGMEKFRALFAETPSMARVLEKQVAPFMGMKGDGKEEEEFHEEESEFVIGDELQTLLDSIGQESAGS